MVSTDYDKRSISSITLALFEDSGWYKANSNYTGGLFRFGKNEGCSFLSDLCIVNEQTNHPREYCIESRKSECFAGQIEKGYCYSFVLSFYPLFLSSIVTRHNNRIK